MEGAARPESQGELRNSGPGCGARGRRRGLAEQRADAPSQPAPHQAPPVRRAPEGPEGTGGLRGAAPNAVRSPSLAGGRALRRPEHQRRHKPRPIGGRRGACGAWPGVEPTRRAKLAARTASGRAGHAAAGDLAGHSNAGDQAGHSNAGDQAGHSNAGGPAGHSNAGGPAGCHNRQRPGRLRHNSPHGSSPRRPRRICYDV